MANTNQFNPPENILKIINDPDVSQEIKDICFKLLKNPVLEQKLKKTSVSSFFNICDEYHKYPEIYDDVISDRIKFFTKDYIENTLPILHHRKIIEHEELQRIFGPNTILGGIIERFAICDRGGTIIKRIIVRVKRKEMMTAAFNAKNQLISIIIDQIKSHSYRNDFLDLINSTGNKSIDLLRA